MVSNPANMNEGEFISYLSNHGISDTEKKKNGKGETEIYFPCPFNGCDDDRRTRGEELHCSFNLSSCTYHCFKCGEDGNYVTLRKFFGDYEEYDAEHKMNRMSIENKPERSIEQTARSIHRKTREVVRSYFNGRGINNDSIDRFMLGIGEFGGRHGFMIPIFDKLGNVAYVKLRRTPEDEAAEVMAEAMGRNNQTPKYIVYPTGSKLLLVGEDQLAKSSSSDVLICEGELDRIIAIQDGVKMPVVTGGGGAQTFKDEWIDSLKSIRNIYLCMDKDEAGENGFKKLAQRLSDRIPTASIYKISLPFKDGTHADLTDYFTKKYGTADELFSKYAKYYCGAKPIDVSQFREITIDDIARVLDLTIKGNYENKIIVFLAMLLTYTEKLQLNIIMNAESSSGKTYLVNEISHLFPEQDVYSYGNTSPTAPYYNEKFKKVDKDKIEYTDLERKILIFEDQPNPQLLANLRSFLSHDSKKTPFMLTNKGKGGKNTAQDSYILGFSSVFFCSANLRIDEQERTRSFILSPENTEEAIRASVDVSITRDKNEQAYQDWLDGNEERNNLKDRILYIKNLGVKYIDIGDDEYLKARFYENLPFVTSGTRRKVRQFMALVKGIALLNAPFRMVDGKIVATNDDIDEAVKLWGVIKEGMSYGVAPEILNFYKAYILQAFLAKKELDETAKGITQDELSTYHYDKTRHTPNFDMLKKVYIPTLKRAKIIKYERDEDNGQRWLIIPLVFFDDNSGVDMEEKN
ncbi:MAG: toprim domain-containing protein [Candidatus Saccharibacteria bacterium]|nr:toprim domain-containing protein [Candidatus Saccharibacteria bacterium]